VEDAFPAAREGEDQAIHPSASLEDQNPTKPMESREHRGEDRNGRQTDEQCQQELLGSQDARFHRRALYRPWELVSWELRVVEVMINE
jgi:hypothetical protein